VNLTVPDLKNVSLQSWNHKEFLEKKIRVDVLRLDKIHPDISGNKWFKLKYYLEKARKTNVCTLVSFGGAYSNHILALAAAARMNGLNSVGYIRGEKPSTPSATLLSAVQYGMKLHFLARNEYRKKKLQFSDTANFVDPDSLIIPEGGASEEGVSGAEEILSLVPVELYSHICCAVGTGTTLAGLVNSSLPHQIKVGVSVLKGTNDLEPLNISWIKNQSAISNIKMIHEHHFGGYGKKTKDLVDFMNQIYTETGIPTDFVYTAKLFFTVYRLTTENIFPPGSSILVLHTGGLQGNLSLTPGQLQF
jgi:1-aminocyclopropane-1-carboxylate deaminase/D-cysteine desulfhydrase-like pyridoxal-dependent ACC family enzyme